MDTNHSANNESQHSSTDSKQQLSRSHDSSVFSTTLLPQLQHSCILTLMF